MFSLPEFTKVKVLDITVLSQKDRAADANPGVRLNVQADLPNYVLAAFDPALRHALFTKSEAAGGSAKDKRQTLPGVEEISDLPHLTSIARHVASTCSMPKAAATCWPGSMSSPRTERSKPPSSSAR